MTATIWIFISMFFLLVELATPGLFFFISFALGALFSAFVALLGYSTFVQCWAGLLIGIIQFSAMRRTLSKLNTMTKESRTTVHAVIGQRAQVMKEVTHQIGGLVKIGGEQWSAITADEHARFDHGSFVRVLRVDGNKVIVADAASTQEEQS